MAQWSAQQILTARAPVQAPGGQSTHMPILVVLWTSCKRPMMEEVECPIGLHGVIAVPQPRSGAVGASHKSTHWMKKMRLLCVVYVAPAESQGVRGATHLPASRDRHPTISHTRVGDMKKMRLGG